MKLPPLPHNLPPFEWTTAHLESFNKLKDALTSAPFLAYPDYSKPFILETDASLKGLGAVLTQKDDEGNFRVISYASHMLKPYERSMRNYSSAKLELLALKWAVCEKFRDYLIGSKFTVLCDNNPLTYVRMPHLGAAQICWLSDLALFDFEIKYGQGNRIRWLTLSVGDLLIQIPHLNLWMTMKNGKRFHMGWFVRCLIIIWNQPRCPIILNMKYKAILLRLMWLINL